MKTKLQFTLLNAALAIASGPLLAQPGIIDQQYAGPFDVGDLCCELIGRRNFAIGQSFRTTQSVLTGVSLHLQNLSLAAKSVTVMLRHGDINGPFVGQFIGLVTVPAAPAPGREFRDWIRLDGFCPIGLVPYDTYTIQLFQTDGNEDVRWSLRALGDPYPNGTGFRAGLVVPWDYGFRTYYLPRATSVTATITSVVVPANVTRGDPFSVVVGYNLAVAPVGAYTPAFASASIGLRTTGHWDSCRTMAGTHSISFPFNLDPAFPVGNSFVYAQVGAPGFNLSNLSKAITVN